MESDTLYSVKWYRNEQEFYRFVPNDKPKLQIFPQYGIRVEVMLHILIFIFFIFLFQRSKSSKHNVVLFDLQLEASGTYRSVYDDQIYFIVEGLQIMVQVIVCFFLIQLSSVVIGRIKQKIT